MIMVQNNAKLRARMVEQLIRLAIGLREMDNFDGLSQQ